MALCGFATFKLLTKINTPKAEFEAAKDFAVFGLIVSMLQWFVTFVTFGSEWFTIWQSQIGTDKMRRSGCSPASAYPYSCSICLSLEKKKKANSPFTHTPRIRKHEARGSQ